MFASGCFSFAFTSWHVYRLTHQYFLSLAEHVNLLAKHVNQCAEFLSETPLINERDNLRKSLLGMLQYQNVSPAFAAVHPVAVAARSWMMEF
jgi:hypothetical protein